MTDKEDIFNRAGYNNLPNDYKKLITKYPAYEIYEKNSYSMEQLEASHPKEFKILYDLFTETSIKAAMCEQLYQLTHDFLFKDILKDKRTAVPIVMYKEKELMKLGEEGERITSKFLKLGDEFEATLDK